MATACWSSGEAEPDMAAGSAAPAQAGPGAVRVGAP